LYLREQAQRVECALKVTEAQGHSCDGSDTTRLLFVFAGGTIYFLFVFIIKMKVLFSAVV
jgi:hypothetical protein